MKHFLIILLLAGSLKTQAGVRADSTAFYLFKARVMTNPHSRFFKPKAAFKIYSKYADQNNAEAINALGVLYNSGLGTTKDEQQAFNLFEKAAKLGYGNAWCNLGRMYKYGITVNQDFKKAYNCFIKGSMLNSAQCNYEAGYMRYKGLGTSQDYTIAINYFKKGANEGDNAACYMLGLCYRNGYGIQTNLDSAKFWLLKSKDRKDMRAIEELESVVPEYQEKMKVTGALSNQLAKGGLSDEVKKGFIKIQQKLPDDDINEKFSGHVIKYDWSGKNIIAEPVVNFAFHKNGKSILGIWQEEGQDKVNIQGSLNDTALIFTNVINSEMDHYHQKNPLTIEFKESKLQLIEDKDSTFLLGTILLASPRWKEPEKPEFVILSHAKNNESVNENNNNKARPDSLNFSAFPNPFSGNLNLRYTIKRATVIHILVTDILSKKTVFQGLPEYKNKGENTSNIQLIASPGNYVVTLFYGNQSKSVKVIKL